MLLGGLPILVLEWLPDGEPRYAEFLHDTVVLCDLVGEDFARPMESAHDRSDGYADDLRDLTILEPFDTPEQKHLAIVRAEVVDDVLESAVTCSQSNEARSHAGGGSSGSTSVDCSSKNSPTAAGALPARLVCE